VAIATQVDADGGGTPLWTEELTLEGATP